MAGILGSGASKVTVQEIDLSTIVATAATDVAAMAIVSQQGRLTAVLNNSATQFAKEYGDGNPSVSMDHYTAREYFREGTTLWTIRAIGSGYSYAGVLMYQDGGVTKLVARAATDPANPDFTTQPAGASASWQPIAYFYPTMGPGIYANSRFSLGIEANAALPVAVTATAGSGGSLPDGAYTYYVAPVTINGDGAVTAVTVNITGQSGAGKVSFTLPTTPAAGVLGYRLYGRTAAQSGMINTVATGVSLSDDGSLSPNYNQQPNTSVPSNLPFTVKLYDSNVSASTPSQSFYCTLATALDDTGLAMDLENRINPYSDYIQVTSFVPFLATPPQVTTTTTVAMAGGLDGAAPTASDINNALAVFKSKQLYKINMMMNGGHSTPAVQKQLDAIASGRGDCLAILDMPSASQSVQAALTYRNLTLGINSSYSALYCPDILIQDDVFGRQQYIPPSGVAAAIMARTNRVANPGFAPAGMNRGAINQALKTRYTYDPDSGDQDQLFQAQINYTNKVIGAGTFMWEQQTLTTKQSALKWISVRNILNVCKTAMVGFLIYSLQEPDDDFTGRQIVSTINQYLDGVANQRAITSGVCISDSSNNSAAMLNSGIRVVTVVIVPLIPIHQIQLQCVVSKTGVSFSEVLKSVTQ